MRDVYTHLAHHLDHTRPHVAGIEPRTEDFKTIAGIVSQKPFAHLATRHVARADDQYSSFVHGY